MSKILITAPHSLCDQNISYRNCDLISQYASISLHNIIPGSDLFLATEYRHDIDLNRDLASFTPYRKSITNKINGNNGILLDIHSFPNNYFGQYSIVIVDNEPGTQYGKSLFYALHHVGVSTVYNIGDENKNSIVREARKSGFKAILLEYNENISKDNINKINNLIALWIKLF